MSVDAQHHEAEILLRTEHAVDRVLTDACDEATAFPLLLAAIGESLGWDVGALWREEDGGLRCVESWGAVEPFAHTTLSTLLAPGEGLPGTVWASGEPAWLADVSAGANLPRGPSALQAGLRTAFCFPIRGSAGILGVIEFLAGEQREPEDRLLATMTSLGSRIGQCVERWRAEDRLRENDARKTAMLNAAFDSIITIDAAGNVVEVNQATEQMFGYTAAEMIGRDLADLIIPLELREPHRRGLERYVATGSGTRRMVGHPVELPAMRADGSQFPVEIAITRPQVEGAPVFTGFLRDVTKRKRDEQELRTLVAQQVALRQVATVVAAEADREHVFAVVTEQVGRLLGAATCNMVRYEADDTDVVVGAWSTRGVRSIPVGTRMALDGPTVAAQIHDTHRAARVETYEGMAGTSAALLRGIGFRSAVGAPIKLAGRLWGAVMVSTVEEEPFPPGSEQRVADFTELVSLALANAQAREELAASRARIVAAGDDERRRLERNLHDGAQQRLVALALTLRVLGKQLTDGDPAAPELLDRAGDELSEALEELRELARGIHPSILTERGLVPALRMLAGRASVPVELSAPLEDRLPGPVEAAAYYIVAEALTNASKHARATHVKVRVRRGEDGVLVEVADDGVGGADQRGGSGVRGLGDRVEALGGTLELVSPPGAGTTLSARMPCA